MGLFKRGVTITPDHKIVAEYRSITTSKHEVSLLQALEHLLLGSAKPEPVTTSDGGSQVTYRIEKSKEAV